MGSYRDAYPSGAASASAAYHYYGALAEASMRDGSLRGSLNLVAGGGAQWLDNGGGLLGQFHGRTLLAAQCGDIDLSANGHSHRRMPAIDAYRRTLITDLQASGSDERVSYRQSFYPGVNTFSLSSSRTGAGLYCNPPVHFEPQSEQTPPSSIQASDSEAERKRKTPSLDALIRETWELHSLFRAGLPNDSKKSRRGGNGFVDITPRLKKAKHLHCTDDTVDTGGLWEENPLETPSSWKELDASRKETRKKPKDSTLLLDLKQEQYASNVQKFTCERVMDFMGDSSDDHNSDDDSFEDSDDGVPNVGAESTYNVKSREEQAYEFFLQMLEENTDLQKLYNEQCHVGKFECLVCSGIPGKPSKKYNGLISVIMHASKIIKTKKKQEHRGYARAVCSAMGWDICRLPTMPSSSSPHPRCCIPADEQENTDAEEIEEALTRRENDESGALDSEENSADEQKESAD